MKKVYVLVAHYLDGSGYTVLRVFLDPLVAADALDLISRPGCNQALSLCEVDFDDRTLPA